MLDHWNLRDILRPFVKKVMNLVLGNVMRDVKEIDQMTKPRVIKSHLPLFLLHPELLDTAKVLIYFHVEMMQHRNNDTRDDCFLVHWSNPSFLWIDCKTDSSMKNDAWTFLPFFAWILDVLTVVDICMLTCVVRWRREAFASVSPKTKVNWLNPSLI